ncbi:MAG: HTTM domain-containing protein [Nevskia sp.]|nr:HTTM domain-containing protein [Nevskia sp.]
MPPTEGSPRAPLELRSVINRAWPLVRARLDEVFGIDLRTLALFRVCVGTVLFIDMIRRFSDLRAFYTDQGVLPRSWLAQLEGPWRFSLHAASGGAWYEALLLAVAVLAAFALMIGWRARLAAFVSWLLLASLCTRNPLILLGGDYLLTCLLFWAMFLPIGARFSVDAALSQAPLENTRHLSWASAALTLQVLSVWFFGALMKTGHQWWPDGTAVYYTLSLDGYSWPWSHWLLHFPRVMQGLTYFVYWLEMLGPLLALSPFFTRPLRFVVMALLTCMHTGFLLLLAIGFFPWVSLSSLTVLVGGWVWERLARRRPLGEGVRLYYDGQCGACLKLALLLRTFLILPRMQLQPAQSAPRAETLWRNQKSWVLIDENDRAWLKGQALIALLRRSPAFFWLGALLSGAGLRRAADALHDFLAGHKERLARWIDARLPYHQRRFTSGRIAQGVAALLMAACLAWNLATVALLPFGTFALLTPIIYPLRIEQFWQMFAPFPFTDNGWYVMPGKLADGSSVDVLRPGKPLSYDKPWSIALDFPNQRWQVYENRMYDHRFAQHRLYWARYLCREWNREAPEDKKLLSFNIVYMLMRTPPPGGTAHLEQLVLWRHQCVPPQAPPPEGEEGGAQLDSHPQAPR